MNAMIKFDLAELEKAYNNDSWHKQFRSRH